MAERQSSSYRVVVIGSGWHFASGISHYTYRLSVALAEQYAVSALLMRRLVPKRLYPGSDHVGVSVTDATYPAHVPVYDGVDWYWGPSLTGALRFLDQQRPTVVILQWWTGAVLHTYLRLARHAAALGARVILEWHEGQDVGEAALLGTRDYVRMLMPRLLARVDAHVVHSSFDLRALESAYSLGNAPIRVIPHGPYDHLARPTEVPAGSPDRPLRLLYLGVVRPFKGVEDLVDAFSALGRDLATQFRLTVVGETWEDWTVPDQAISRSPHMDLIERVDRYVTDAELTAHFAQADAVVLPYHRSSSSGPLQIAMSAGLPVVVTAVGGLVEAVQDYPGALLVPPHDPKALQGALLQLLDRRRLRYADPHSWQRTVKSYCSLIDKLCHRENAHGRLAKDRSGLSHLPVTVVICAYTMKRWDAIHVAVTSVLSQHPQPAQMLLIIDHNAALADRARRELFGAEVLESKGPPGLSGARNTGLIAATQPITVFLDDDAEARPGWLASLIEPYQSSDVVATGGAVEPRWPNLRPSWLPPEFDWVVGCGYVGLPDSGGIVRNPIGANMSMRTQLALEVGGFDVAIGRVGNPPTGCEETELAIRLTAERPGSVVYYAPDAAVDHHVTPERVKFRYFLRRCWHEGVSKASVVQLVGASAGLERERRQVVVVIPMQIIRDLSRFLHGDPNALLRVCAAVSGLSATAVGYLSGSARYRAKMK